MTPSASAGRDVEPRRPLVRRPRRAHRLARRRRPAPHRGRRPPRTGRLFDPPHLGTMAPRRTWAAVATRAPLAACPIRIQQPPSRHRLAGPSRARCCRGAAAAPSRGAKAAHADKTIRTLDVLVGRLPRERLIWGGDWNHALTGREYAGSIGGRTRCSRHCELDLKCRQRTSAPDRRPLEHRPHRGPSGIGRPPAASTQPPCPTTTPTSWSSHLRRRRRPTVEVHSALREVNEPVKTLQLDHGGGVRLKVTLPLTSPTAWSPLYRSTSTNTSMSRGNGLVIATCPRIGRSPRRSRDPSTSDPSDHLGRGSRPGRSSRNKS